MINMFKKKEKVFVECEHCHHGVSGSHTLELRFAATMQTKRLNPGLEDYVYRFCSLNCLNEWMNPTKEKVKCNKCLWYFHNRCAGEVCPHCGDGRLFNDAT